MDEPVVTKTNNPDWDFLLATLKEDRCILLLGPDIIKVSDPNDTTKVRPIQDALLDYLDAYRDPNILKYYSQDELFLFKDMPAQTKVFYKIKRFYANTPVKRDIYENITKVPFPLIVSVSPDMYLDQAFATMGFRHRFEVYKTASESHAIAPITGQDPVIYNLFGYVDDEESLVLTHDGLFDFLSAIMGKRPLPNEIENMFQRATNIIFLGFKFEKWYVQLLLRLLKIHNSAYNRSSKYSSKITNNGSSEIEDLCREQFHIDFIDTQIEDFIETLCEKCKEEGILRSVKNSKNNKVVLTGIPRIEQLIKEGKIAEALEELNDFVDNNNSIPDDLSKASIAIYARYNRFEIRRTSGVLTSAEAEVEMAIITENTLALTSLMKKL
ncbi:SIR2 family protein [Mucilaginibacter endophyticus]|uniref:SIR2 family protein n=1 Tax=Mucilaginibacter endophyticus TaxID=2675003 RepID=UPI000E0DFCCF|nr:SIR2 family protein [Mucilaginibacter endophyticus]